MRRNRYGKFLTGCTCEAAFLQIPASRNQEVPLSGRKRFTCEARLDVVCDSKIDVVASEQQVIADGDTLDMGKG